MKSYKNVEVEIPENLYNDLIKLNIDVEKEVVTALERLVRCSFMKVKLEEEYQKENKTNLGFAKMCLEANEDAL